MNSLINKANRQLTHIRNDILSLHDAVERAASTSSLVGQLSASFSGLQETLRDLEMLSKNEASPEKREEYRAKVKLLQTDLQTNRQRFDSLKLRIQEQERKSNREELLRSRNPTNDEGETNLTERLIAQREDEVLSHASSRLDDYISIGMATISDLKAQKNALKSTQQRLLDATASLGISQSLMRLINQRSNQERAIFYGGVILTVLVIFILWRYF